MTIFIIALMLALIVAIWLRLAYKIGVKDALDEKAKLQKEYDFLKETVATWTTKPVYALLSDAQIAEIGRTVGQYIKEPKWLN